MVEDKETGKEKDNQIAEPIAAIPAPVPEVLTPELQEFVDAAKKSTKPFAETIKEYVAMKYNAAAVESEEMKTVRAEMEGMRTVMNQRLKSDVEETVTEIKTYDREFNSTKLLEGVKELPVQQKLLEVYLTSLKKHARPISLALSPDQAATQVNRVAEEMFGDKTMTPEKLLGLKKQP
jgi:hypothetical protein